MKRIVILVFLGMFLAGCGGNKGVLPAGEVGSAAVLPDVNAGFPDDIVGVWVVKDAKERVVWGFKFEKDGSIKKMHHITTGVVKLDGELIYWEGKQVGDYATFVFGPVEASFDPNTRELSVKAILENFTCKIQDVILKGTSEDYFDGIVSEDGLVWNADWYNFSTLEGADPTDPNEILAEPLVFRKLLDSNLEEVKKGQK